MPKPEREDKFSEVSDWAETVLGTQYPSLQPIYVSDRPGPGRSLSPQSERSSQGHAALLAVGRITRRAGSSGA